MSSDIGEAGGPTSQQGHASWAARGSAQSPDRTSAEQGAVVAAAGGSTSSSETAGQAEQDLTAVASQAPVSGQAGSAGSASAAHEPSGIQPVAGDPGTSYDRGDLAVQDAFTGDGRYSEGDAAGEGLSDAPTGVPHEAT